MIHEVVRRLEVAAREGAESLDLSYLALKHLPSAPDTLADVSALHLSGNGEGGLPGMLGNLTNLTELNLSGNQLGELPGWLGGLTNLTELNLSGNQVRELPGWLGGLTNLTKLNLSGNQVRELPGWLGGLTNLTKLNLSGNQLKDLPGWLGGLTNLTELYLDADQLSDLPDWLHNLTKLHLFGDQLPDALGDLNNLAGLYLHGNQLTELPHWLGNLADLTELHVTSNRLRELPGWLGGLTNLTKLNLLNNQLSELPDTLGNLANLTDLLVSNNQLSELPDTLGNLTNLQALGLFTNRLSGLPDTLGTLTGLTFLDLGGNKFGEVPAFLGNWTGLNVLYLDDNQFNEVPSWLGNLTGLIRLYVNDNQLSGLPDSLGNLTNLTELNLCNSQLSELPGWLGNLTNLSELDIQNNQLSRLPDSLGNLTNLTELNLSKNQLSGLPDSLGSLSNLTKLLVSDNQLSELPGWLGNLINLTELYVSKNQLSGLPDSLGSLSNLTKLNLSNNQLGELPGWLGNLINLAELYVSNNQLSGLPDSLGSLSNLTELNLSNNQLGELPGWLGNLINLAELYVSNNQLSGLPDSLGSLSNLTKLNLSKNQLSELPDTLGNLTNLAELGLEENNTLLSPPPEIQASGATAVLAFLRAMQEGSQAQWTSKMLVVGEAMVGKTSVAKALCRLPYDKDEPQTHGVHLDPLDLLHPQMPDVTMRLNVWDFGGQLEYRATQRFYLTDRSLFLLVWNSRQGWRTGGQVEAWLQAITHAAPDSPILVVATHCAASVADLDGNDLQNRYPQVKGVFEVDCFDETGIDVLRAEITRQAGELPLMGRAWPDTWAAAAQRLTSHPGRYLTVQQADELLRECGLGEEVELATLRAALHDRGEILHYPLEPRLRDYVILQPTWVDGMITRVLDSREVKQRGGLLGRAHRAGLWSDLGDTGLADMLIALMERFDLAYSLDSPDHEDVALVVERLPAGEPPLPTVWEQILQAEGASEVAVTYRLPSRQAGIPSWFIAREHRYTTNTAWARGVLLRHHDHVAGTEDGSLRPMALLKDDDATRPTIRLTVRGPNPHTFYSILDEAFTGILAERYRGLDVKRFVPCPCTQDQDCAFEFPYDAAQRALDRQQRLQCQESFEMIDPRTLLFGLRPFPLEAALAGVHDTLGQLAQTTTRIERSQLHLLDNVRDLLRHRGEQGTHCPSIFTISKIGMLSYELRLYCEHPDGPHPLEDNAGVYALKRLPDWLRRYGPYLKVLLTALRYTLPVAGPILSGIAGVALGGWC